MSVPTRDAPTGMDGGSGARRRQAVRDAFYASGRHAGCLALAGGTVRT